jgi:hypothetical protein
MVSNISCNDTYKAGNSSPLLGIQIESNINQDIAFKYFDTSKEFESFQLPEKFKSELKKGGDLEYLPASNKIFYFKDFPEEAYHLSSSGIFYLEQVYNPSIGGSNWIYEKSKLKTSDLIRIQDRIKAVLNKIIISEKTSKMPDSIIFLNKPYDSLTCILKTE